MPDTTLKLHSVTSDVLFTSITYLIYTIPYSSGRSFGTLNTPNQGAKQKKESNAEKEQREKAKEASENGIDFNED
ncbi:hypothetical protein C8J56DRAFT_1058231 [Mycena floridula]|nr:hypothetical protein C8J56DRAFT_1058231 [Mycena floridula]